MAAKFAKHTVLEPLLEAAAGERLCSTAGQLRGPACQPPPDILIPYRAASDENELR